MAIFSHSEGEERWNAGHFVSTHVITVKKIVFCLTLSMKINFVILTEK